MAKHRIEFSDPKEVIIFEGKEYLLCQKKDLDILINKLDEYKADISKLKITVDSVLKILGLIDENTGAIKATIQSGEEGYFKYILKGLNKMMFLLVQAQMSKSAQKELENHFSFIKTLLPTINKYAGK